jgi:3-dehydro-L-gulonate 2-dehydrogenase
MLRVPYPELEAALHRAVLHLGLVDELHPFAAPLSTPPATLCGRLFAETTRDGVYTHGLARFPRFAAMVRSGAIDPLAYPDRTSMISDFGSIERWDGHRGPGNLNAWSAMSRAMDLARLHGMGAVALANTNHWMRGGTYGWQAATQGFFGICWTNTLANTPAWGSSRPTVGNNPLIVGIPRDFPSTRSTDDPAPRLPPVVLDMAMTQFSMGSLSAYAQRGAKLPVHGGYDVDGNLSHDPAAIEASQRPLPIGYWKGFGLSLVLDMMASMLAGGLATHQLSPDPLKETGLSQFFLAIDPVTIADPAQLSQIAEAILADLRQSPAHDPAKPVRYPGEETLRLREENLRLGVPVDPTLWQQLNDLTI